jgi:hypothetical protein
MAGVWGDVGGRASGQLTAAVAVFGALLDSLCDCCGVVELPRKRCASDRLNAGGGDGQSASFICGLHGGGLRCDIRLHNPNSW